MAEGEDGVSDDTSKKAAKDPLQERLFIGGLLAVLAFLLGMAGADLWVIVLLAVGATYQLVVAAIGYGVREANRN